MVGEACDVQRHQQTGSSTRSVLTMRLEPYDTTGNRLSSVSVEFRDHYPGRVGQVERVDATAKCLHGALIADSLVNLTTGAEMRSASGVRAGVTVTRRHVFSAILLAVMTAGFALH